ncbi:outer membrane beta-barrel protein [Chitinophaga oryziterrae]|uniref:Outer membrane beta-barrel protein n=1 Tax=Chitinophaga oryziterrae TaxID=1031224 RepID=A0A6N8J8E1_9BACT|nr:outer membrane beta-barrel protein [Chitinophaga oryziterrae]
MYYHRLNRSYKSILPLILLLLVSYMAVGQQTGMVWGQLSDTTNHQLLKDAFITVSRVSDDSIQKRFFSTENGSFSCDRLPYGNYLIHISIQGLQPVQKKFTLNDQQKQLDMGIIYMHIRVMELDTLVVQEAAVLIKKDTVEYNAGRFQTNQYASLSDLLKLLPGLQLKNDGNISINGQPIDQIMVDGKPFFNGDPQTALTHLPAEIIKKIQVYTTTQNNLSGVPPPPGFPGNKTINLVLKADKRKGDFGKLSVGAGTGGAFNSNGDLNHMNGGQQISVIGDAGNIDRENTRADLFSRASGITRNLNGGVNYRDSRNDHTSINGSYMNSDQRNENSQRIHVLNIFPGNSSTVLDQNLNMVTHNNTQRFNLNLEHKPDAFNSFIFQQNVMLQRTNTVQDQQNTQHYESSGDRIYQSSGNNSSNTDRRMISSTLQYRHNGQQPGQMLSLELNMFNNYTDYNGSYFTQTTHLSGSSSLNQHNTNTDHVLVLSPSMNYMMPIGKQNILNIRANYSYTHDDIATRTYSFNGSTQHFDQLDTTQSNDFKSSYHNAAMQMSIRKQWNKITLTAGTGIAADWLSGDNKTNQSHTTRHFINMLPSVTLGLGSGLQVSYTGKPVVIIVQQLQPVSVTADSLFIQEGNPDLQEPYTHSLNLGYSVLRPGTQQFFSASFSGSITMHSIQHAVSLMDNGAQISKPVNLNGAQNLSLILNYAIPALQRKSGFNIAANATYSKDPLLSNGIRNKSSLLYFSSTFTWNFHTDKGIDLNISSTPAYNSMHTSMGQTSQYFIAIFGGKASYTRDSWESALSAYYTFNNSLPGSYQPDYPIIAPFIGYRFLKRKAAQVNLSINDLLNQQSGAYKSIEPGTVTDTWSRTRGRYLLVTFTYNFSRFGGGNHNIH